MSVRELISRDPQPTARADLWLPVQEAPLGEVT